MNSGSTASPGLDLTAHVVDGITIAELTGEQTLRQELRNQLEQAFDLQRLTSRISTGRASPRDPG